MSHRRPASGPTGGAAGGARRWSGAAAGAAAGLLVAVLLAVAVAAVAPVGAESGGLTAQGGELPELSGGERLNDTAVELVISDDSGVDLASIDRSEFLVSAGDIDAVSARESGTDAHVVVRLAAPIDEDELTVAVRDGSEISDVQGNRIDTEGFVGVTIDGMDAVPPALRRLEVPEYGSDAIEYRLVFDEPVDSFEVAIGGPRKLRLDREDFERVRGSQYVLTYEPPVDGVYTFEVLRATDGAGNTDTFAAAQSTEVQSTSVRAVASIDLSASSGLNFTFDASQSEQRARAYLWEFGDGETATGERVSHTFAPGNYTVRLEVIDEFGNVGRDRLTLNLTEGRTDISTGGDDGGPVSVVHSGSPRPTDAQVTVEGSDPEESLMVRAPSVGGPLVATEVFSLEELMVSPADGGPFGVGLSVLPGGDERLAGAGDAVGGEPVAGFHARPTVDDGALSAVRVRFSVARDRLDAAGVDPENVTLARNANGTWTAAPTSVRSVSRNRASFRATVPGFSRFAVVATTDTDEGGGEENESNTDGNGDGGQPTNDQFAVRNVSLSETSIEPGGVVEVQAEVLNNGAEPGDYVAALSVDGTVVQTREVLRIPPDGESLPVTFTRQFNESGAVQLSINGTAAPELTVGDDGGGGGLFSFLSILPLGFLPLGLLKTVLLYVVAPLLLAGGVLKGVASYLGY